MMARLNRYFTAACHWLVGSLFLALCILLGMAGGALTRDTGWPYIMQKRVFLTKSVEPGDPILVSRQIRYLDDCELHYEYRAQSEVQPYRRAFNFPDVDYEHPPMDLDGVPKTTAYYLPADFPCGPAYFVESPSVACNWWQRNWRRLRKDDTRTPFEVVGCRQANEAKPPG